MTEPPAPVPAVVLAIYAPLVTVICCAVTITEPALPLDRLFALNPAMPNLHRLFTAGQASIVHAVATPYRERSHFDGQDVLESGLAAPGATDSGWLNRALSALEPGGRVDPG